MGRVRAVGEMGIAVQYMVVEHFTKGARVIYERAKESGRMLPDGLVYLDS